MDYFQELLNSYQLIKKRKFSVSYSIDEAVDLDPIAKQKADQYISTATTKANEPSPNNKVPVPEIPDSSLWVAKEGTAAGQVVFDGFPNRQGRAIALTGNRPAPQNYNEFVGLLSQGAGPSDTEGGDAEQLAAQKTMPVASPRSERKGIAITLGQLARDLKNSKTFFTSAKDVPGVMFKWLTGTRPEDVTEFFHDGSKSDLFNQIERARHLDNTPLSDDQKKQFLETFQRYLEVCNKLDKNPNDITLNEDFQDMAKIMQFGSGVDKGKMRIQVGVGNNNYPIWATFSWSAQSNTNLIDHINLSYEKKVKEWAKNQTPAVSEDDVSDYLLPRRRRFADISKSVGSYNQIVGDLGEEIPIIVSKVIQAIQKKLSDSPESMLEVRKKATSDLIKITRKYGYSLFEALRLTDQFKTGQVAVLDPSLGVIKNIDEMLDMSRTTITQALDAARMEIEQQSGISMTDENLKILSDVLVNNSLARAYKINVIIQEKLKPKSIIRVGESPRNGKKTDHLYTYDSIDEVRQALTSLMPKGTGESDQAYASRIDGAIQKYSRSMSEALTMYPEIRKGEINKDGFVLHVGVKTSIADGNVSFGTSTPKESDSNFTAQKVTKQIDAIYKRVEAEHGVSRDEVRQFFKTSMEARQKMQSTVDKFQKSVKDGKHRLITRDSAQEILSTFSNDQGALAKYKDKLNSGKITESLYQEILSKAQDRSDRVHFSTIKNAINSSDPLERNKGIAFLDALISNASTAEEVPQFIAAGVLSRGSVKFADQNDTIKSLISGIKDKSIRLKPDSGNFVFEKCEAAGCKIKSSLGTFGLADGGYAMSIGSGYLKERNNLLTGSSSGYLGENTKVINDIVSLLLEQRKMINLLLSKY